MNVQRCLEILREVKDVAFATVDEKGLPQIRIIDVMLVENEKLYFCTAGGKDFYSQIIKNSQVAITGMNQNFQMIRLDGKAEKLEEHRKWIDRIFEENPSMNTVYPNESRYVLEAFCIENGSVEFFELGKEPIVRESFMLGSAKTKENGFLITDACIQCGKCGDICPQKCITEYKINQKHCLHCGLCAEECPVGAVKKGFLFESIMGAFRNFSGCYCDSCFIRWHSRNPDR